MADPYFHGQTLDDVMHLVFDAVLSRGEDIAPSKGPAKELRGVLIEIDDPLSRLSRTETRGKPFSCLGEFCWYLAKTNALDFIFYYIPEYEHFADGNEVYGAYGPRFFEWKGLNQVGAITNLLKRKADSRQAVIQLFDANDLLEEHKDIPCTCTLQFMLRQERLHLLTSMRSNDAYLGMPHDIFAFTMLQELVARSLSTAVGSYKHVVGSLHIYDDRLGEAREYLDEGWQSTTMPMPPMPDGDPWPAIGLFLRAEQALREGQSVDKAELESLDSYWADLVRLLQVFRYSKDKEREKIETVRDQMASNVYRLFIEQRMSRKS